MLTAKGLRVGGPLQGWDLEIKAALSEQGSVNGAFERDFYHSRKPGCAFGDRRSWGARAGQGAPLGQEWLLEEMPCMGAAARLWGGGSALLSRLPALGSALLSHQSSAAPIPCSADLGSATAGSGALWDLATGCLPTAPFWAQAGSFYPGASLSVHIHTCLGNPPGFPHRPVPPVPCGLLVAPRTSLGSPVRHLEA